MNKKYKLLLLIILFIISDIIIIKFNHCNKRNITTQEKTKNEIVKETININNLLDDAFKKVYINAKCLNQNYLDLYNKTWNDGWAVTQINIREQPNTESKILGELLFNEHVKFYRFNEDWFCINYEGKIAYVYSKYINYEENKYIEYEIKDTSGFKSYMPYTTITSKSTLQYILQKDYAYTGDYGIRQVNNRYCVAIGTAFNADIGTYLDLILENGEIIPCILGDIKSNRHTNENNIFTLNNGCVSEFIVNPNYIEENVKKSGDISFSCEEWNSNVFSIRIYEKNIFK